MRKVWLALLPWLAGCELFLGIPPSLLVEDRPETCLDGLDNDENGLSDCQETGCAAFCGEVCDNGIDDDQDGFTDCTDNDCRNQAPCGVPLEVCNNLQDDDQDGFADCADDDCRFSVDCVFGEQRCDNGQDDDDNGLIDCDDPTCFDDPVCAVCGDGVVQVLAGEECDDGNADNGDSCTNQCISARCGDGLLQTSLGEECDDGNDVENDACPNNCRLGGGLFGETEPNNIDSQADGPFVLATQLGGQLSPAGDLDVFRLENNSGNARDLLVTAQSDTNCISGNLELEIHDAAQSFSVNAPDIAPPANFCPLTTLSFPPGGVFFLVLRASDATATINNYTLSIAF
jgi:cysteine-rich repeat protein